VIFSLQCFDSVGWATGRWVTSVPILVFLGLSVLDLGPMYAVQTDVRSASSLFNAPYTRGGA